MDGAGPSLRGELCTLQGAAWAAFASAQSGCAHADWAECFQDATERKLALLYKQARDGQLSAIGLQYVAGLELVNIPAGARGEFVDALNKHARRDKDEGSDATWAAIEPWLSGVRDTVASRATVRDSRLERNSLFQQRFRSLETKIGGEKK